ncbi:MAG: CDP-alcohol phosphatidyltransferase family protein [Chthoniobacterales bacterium]
MSSAASSETAAVRPLGRVLILADESANWKIAGRRQLDRLALTLNEFARSEELRDLVGVQVLWHPDVRQDQRWLPSDRRLRALHLTNAADELVPDLILSTHLLLERESIPQLLLASVPSSRQDDAVPAPPLRLANGELAPWRIISTKAEIPAGERAFLRESGKSQDGLVSRHLNRPVSRAISRWLLKLPLAPSTWSLLIFALPILASLFLLRGSYLGFVWGTAIFQLYSILDGCDGEIARAKFLESEFGRRLDSLCDLVGNMMLALSLSLGLARQGHVGTTGDWFYISEGLAAAILIATSEGIVFTRRSRLGRTVAATGRWNGALYARHHEFLERSGILMLGENAAWWLVQFTKRDMAMLAFVVLALAGWPAGILHLLCVVSAVSSALAANAFLRQPAPALPQEAS